LYYYIVLVELGDGTQKSLVFSLYKDQDLHTQIQKLLGMPIRILDLKVLGDWSKKDGRDFSTPIL
jgi:hypothetical protein